MEGEVLVIEERVLGALVGTWLGAHIGGSRAGATRNEIEESGVGIPPDVTRPVQMPGLSGDAAEDLATAPQAPSGAASVGAWVVGSVRHGVSRRCDPMAGFVAALPGVDSDRLHACAAAAVAAAVSAAVDGADAATVRSLAVMAADEATSHARDVPGPDVASRLAWAAAIAARADGDPLDVIDLLVGATAAPQECVPAAFAVLAAHEDVGDGVQILTRAASLGGAADVIAMVVGAVLGAGRGPSIFGALGRELVSSRGELAEMATAAVECRQATSG